MENKYYTPEIEEFHQGFEYEYKASEGYNFLDKSKDWKKETFSHGISYDESEIRSIKQGISKKNGYEIRVKHLDREDIEECGFIYIVGNEKYDYLWGAQFLKPFKGEDKYLTIRKDGDKWELAIQDRYDYEGCDSFLFNIKNKSELKKLLKQIDE